jgi:hypothetical protein
MMSMIFGSARGLEALGPTDSGRRDCRMHPRAAVRRRNTHPLRSTDVETAPTDELIRGIFTAGKGGR